MSDLDREYKAHDLDEVARLLDDSASSVGPRPTWTELRAAADKLRQMARDLREGAAWLEVTDG